MQKIRLQPGEVAPDYILKTRDGEEVALRDLWANGPTVLTFLRHFG